jgi:hypothetical protein
MPQAECEAPRHIDGSELMVRFAQWLGVKVPAQVLIHCLKSRPGWQSDPAICRRIQGLQLQALIEDVEDEERQDEIERLERKLEKLRAAEARTRERLEQQMQALEERKRERKTDPSPEDIAAAVDIGFALALACAHEVDPKLN